MGVLRNAITMYCVADERFDSRKLSELKPELRIGGVLIDPDELDKYVEATMNKRIEDDRAYLLSQIASLMFENENEENGGRIDV